jgi:hypothetical protein
MRDKFFKKIREIQRDPGYQIRDISLDYLYYEVDGQARRFSIEDVEYNLLNCVADTFFSDRHREYIPELGSDDIKLELFAHTFPRWAKDCGSEKIVWMPGRDNKDLGDYLGPFSDHDYTTTLHMKSGDLSHDFISFRHPDDDILRVWPLTGSDKVLKTIITRGFPLAYLSGVVSEPSKLTWDKVSQEAVDLYLKHYAKNPKEIKSLIITTL